MTRKKTTKTTRKTTRPRTASKKNKEDSLKEYLQEAIMIGHMIKYNLYLLSKSIVFNAVLQKEGDVSKAANFAHAVLLAFHDQDHRVPEDTDVEDVKK